MSQTCHGFGDCFIQKDDLSYSEDSKDADIVCEYNCRLVSCPNAVVCDTYKLPIWVIGIPRSGVCIVCDLSFGKKLDIVENTECPICTETTTCVIQPRCTHPTCISCFKRCQFGDPQPQPPFPYSDEVEDEWDEVDDDDPEFHAKYPLVRQWMIDFQKHAIQESLNTKKEESLRVCPLCRK
jgi:hypothetical protein